jgi:hypothetical protein
VEDELAKVEGSGMDHGTSVKMGDFRPRQPSGRSRGDGRLTVDGGRPADECCSRFLSVKTLGENMR